MMPPSATFDEAFLALLAGEGSLQRTEFVSLALSIDDRGPIAEDQVLGWLVDAQDRTLVRVDQEDDLVTLTQEGQNQLIELMQGS